MSLSQTRDDVDVEAAIDGLYRLDIAAFTDMRNALSKRLTATGNRVAAEAVRALKKPNVSAWAVNQLWWNERGLFEGLLDAARQVREAQARGAGAIEQQRLTAERRRAVDGLLAQARRILETGGRAASTGLLRKVMTTLEACAATPDALPAPGPGRLHEDLDPPGFEALAGLLLPQATERPTPPAAPLPPDELSVARDRAAEASKIADEARIAAENAQIELETREAEAEVAEAAARTAARAAELAQQTHRAAKARADELRAVLEQRLESLRLAQAEVVRLRGVEPL